MKGLKFWFLGGVVVVVTGLIGVVVPELGGSVGVLGGLVLFGLRMEE